MIIKTKELKDCCSKLLTAVDNTEISTLTETLELYVQDSTLFLNVTNNEYYMSIKFNLDHTEEFHATVNAVLFLKLMSQITTPEVELICKENYLNIKANGNYKIPFIFDGDKLLNLPKIIINNKINEMNISGDNLLSILNFNSKELLKSSAVHPIQKLYYIDQEGCVTFSSGACVNNFTLEKPIRILINNKLVKLFKLFKSSDVKLTLGYDQGFDNQVQTKVSFETSDITLTAILPCDEVTLDKFKATKIRDIANNSYLYSAVVSTDALKQAVARLLLFTSATNVFGDFTFTDKLTISGVGENIEELTLQNSTVDNIGYKLTLNLTDLKLVLDSCTDQYITLNFGYEETYSLPRACVLVRGTIKNVLPECVKR